VLVEGVLPRKGCAVDKPWERGSKHNCLRGPSPLILGNSIKPYEHKPWEGNLDDVSLWGRALSGEEIRELYQNRDGVPAHDDPALLGAWSFDELEATVPTGDPAAAGDETGIAQGLVVRDLSRRGGNLGYRLKGSGVSMRPALSRFVRAVAAAAAAPPPAELHFCAPL